jgi:hypothetical protein
VLHVPKHPEAKLSPSAIELIHPMREGRSLAQIGKKGQSNHRWIVGGKLCFILNQ